MFFQFLSHTKSCSATARLQLRLYRERERTSIFAIQVSFLPTLATVYQQTNFPASLPDICVISNNKVKAYLSPRTSVDSTNFLTSSTSSFVNLTSTAAEFSSNLSTLLVPGIGIIYHQPCSKQDLGHHRRRQKRGSYIITLSKKPSK
jgi:hypothetical protein